MPAPVVALDADALVPILACDFLLTAFELGLYVPVVSAKALDEVETTLIEDFPHLDPAAIRWRVGAMRIALEDHIIDADPAVVPEAINPKDRHVVAAAIVGEAEILTTNDARLRREIESALPHLQTVSLDAFALELWNCAPSEVSAVVDALVAKRTNPPTTRDAILGALTSLMPSATERFGDVDQ